MFEILRIFENPFFSYFEEEEEEKEKRSSYLYCNAYNSRLLIEVYQNSVTQPFENVFFRERNLEFPPGL